MSFAIPAGRYPPLEDLTTPYGASFFLLVLDPGCFAGKGIFTQKVDRLIEDCITCPPVDDLERVYFPGELEAMEEAKRRKMGIPVHKAELGTFFQSLREHNLKVEEKSLV